MAFKRCHVLPASMDVELVGVTYRAKCAVAEAARLLPRGSLYFEHGLVHLALLTGAGMKSGEYKNFHDRFSVRLYFVVPFPISTGLKSKGPLLSTRNTQSEALSQVVVWRYFPPGCMK